MIKTIALPALAASVMVCSSFLSNRTAAPSPLTVNLDVQYDSTGIKPGTDTIVYTRATAVKWTDFKGKPPENFPAAANSAVGFMYRAGVTAGGGELNITIRITAFFVKSQSWVKEKDKSDYILVHEQRHFDLARYGAELFRQKLKSSQFTERNTSRVLDKAYQEAWIAYQQLQNEYDDESEHSINTARQSEWNEKITKFLAGIP